MAEAAARETGENEDREAERIEKRLVGRALSHWDRLRGSRRFPSHSDYLGGPVPYDESNMFVIRVGETEYADEVISSGAAVREALGVDPVGRKAMDVLPSSTEMGLSFCRAAAQMQKPIADVGRFINSEGIDVRYRSILLPLSEDQDHVDHVLCAFSFKFAD